MVLFFFFFNDTATTEIYTLSLHDALPICHFFKVITQGYVAHSEVIGIVNVNIGYVFPVGVRRSGNLRIAVRGTFSMPAVGSQIHRKVVFGIITEVSVRVSYLLSEGTSAAEREIEALVCGIEVQS